MCCRCNRNGVVGDVNTLPQALSCDVGEVGQHVIALTVADVQVDIGGAGPAVEVPPDISSTLNRCFSNVCDNKRWVCCTLHSLHLLEMDPSKISSDPIQQIGTLQVPFLTMYQGEL